MADDDTFDIDIYGDDTQQELEQEPTEPTYEQQGDNAQGDQYNYDNEEFGDQGYEDTTSQAVAGGEHGHDAPVKSEAHDQTPTSAMPQQGTKRKAPEDDYDDQQEHYSAQRPASSSYKAEPDDRPLDPGATPALRLAELHWWTTEEDVRAFCAKASVEHELKDLSFGAHHINGKSRGEVYLEFSSPQAATSTKREVEKVNQEGESGSGVKKTPISVYFSPIGNPFYTLPGQEKKSYDRGSQGYSRGDRGGFGNRGGGFRGGYNQNRGGGAGGSGGGGYGNNQGMYNRPNNAQQQGAGGWGMNGGFNAGGGFGGNPMMAGYGNMNGMGGYGGMNRGGGMMGGMNRGGMMGNMMNMGGMNRGGMMGNMMGMAGMGRGGWGGGGFQQQGGGMQQGFGGGGGGGGLGAGGMQQQQQQGNKRPKME